MLEPLTLPILKPNDAKNPVLPVAQYPCLGHSLDRLILASSGRQRLGEPDQPTYPDRPWHFDLAHLHRRPPLRRERSRAQLPAGFFETPAREIQEKASQQNTAKDKHAQSPQVGGTP